MDMSITLAGVRLPNYLSIQATIAPNESDNVTLGGTLYTDFVNLRRIWVIKWDKLTSAQFDTIYAIYRNQYLTGYYQTLLIPAKSINAPVKLNIDVLKLKWNGEFYEDFTLTAQEQYAFS